MRCRNQPLLYLPLRFCHISDSHPLSISGAFAKVASKRYGAGLAVAVIRVTLHVAADRIERLQIDCRVRCKTTLSRDIEGHFD